MTTLNTLIEIFLLGVVGGAVPGPIMTSVFAETLRSGFSKSLSVVFRALAAESIVALFVLLFFSFLNLPEYAFQVISLSGAAVLVWLALQVWKISAVEGESKEVFTFAKIFVLTILNGGFWIFWITVAVPRAFSLDTLIPLGKFLFLLVFELGWLAAMLSFGFIFSRFRELLRKKNLVSATYKFLAVLLALFALKSVIGSVGYLLWR
ncbi:MAG: LysE family transporter [Candidatus Moraniibacteriota bacterium]